MEDTSGLDVGMDNVPVEPIQALDSEDLGQRPDDFVFDYLRSTPVDHPFEHNFVLEVDRDSYGQDRNRRYLDSVVGNDDWDQAYYRRHSWEDFFERLLDPRLELGEYTEEIRQESLQLNL